MFDDISPNILKGSFYNRGYISVDHASSMTRVNPIKLKVCIKSIGYWNEYFGRFEPIDLQANRI